MSDRFRPAQPHGPLKEVFDNVFFVTGGFRMGPGVVIARNMVVVRTGDELTLLNAIRLSDEGMAELDKLGRVKHVMRLGFFHGADDPYYFARYPEARSWSGKRMVPVHVEDDARMDIVEGGELPIDAKAFRFHGGDFDEAALVLPRDGGVLVTCDAVQNWTSTEGCNFLGGVMMKAMGFIEPAKVGPVWVKRMHPATKGKALHAEFERLASLEFQHLLSAHGTPLMNNARNLLRASVERAFK
jgi:hypothetical protein